MEEKTLSSKYLYDGNIFKLRVDQVSLPNGKKSKREIIEHRGAVAIVPYDEEGNIICVKQYRKAVEQVVLEIPAGRLKEGENPEECARRELQEETGFYPAELKPVCSFYPAVGYSTEIIHIYKAEKLQKTSFMQRDEGEFIEIVKIPGKKEAIIDLIQKGDITDGKTIIGLMLTVFMEERE